MAVGKFVWKHYGINMETLKNRTLPEQFFEYEEIMHIHNDYEYANFKDNEPKN